MPTCSSNVPLMLCWSVSWQVVYHQVQVQVPVWSYLQVQVQSSIVLNFVNLDVRKKSSISLKYTLRRITDTHSTVCTQQSVRHRSRLKHTASYPSYQSYTPRSCTWEILTWTTVCPSCMHDDVVKRPHSCGM